MADVNNDDEQTLDQSNSGASDDQTDDSVVNNQDDTSDDSGNADDSNSDDDGGSDDDQKERKSRGEVRHERYIDKLAGEIRASTDNSRYTDDLFGGSSDPYKPLEYKEDQEYDPKDLEADRKAAQEAARREGVQRGLSQTSPRLERELWADRFDIDSERVTTKWDALNPEKTDSYKPKLEAQLVQKYIAYTGVTRDPQGRISIEKPNIRFRDFVDAEMRNLEEYASERNAQSSKNLVRQAANTGVRPNGQARVSKGGHGFDPNDPVNSVNRMTKKQYFELGGKEASDKYLAERGLA